MCRSLLLFATLLLAPGGLDGGFVVTRTECLEGDVAVSAGGATVGSRTVPWDEVLFMLAHEGRRTLHASHALRLRNGEVWPGRIEELRAGTVALVSPRVGQRREVELTRIAALEFVPARAPSGPDRPATLYRDGQKPIPGRLVYIDGERLAIESPVGVLRVPRRGLLRYVVSRQISSVDDGSDSLELVDGSLFHGRLRRQDSGERGDHLTLEHGALGELRFHPGEIRALTRRPGGILRLVEGSPVEVTEFSLLSAKPRRGQLETIHGSEASIDALILRPKMRLRYSIEIPAAVQLTFRSRISAPDGTRGEVRLRIARGETVVAERTIAADEAGEWLSCELPGTGALSIELDFGESIRFPVGLLLGDPHLIMDPR